ncbi:MAG: hypothetical protein ACO3B3_02015 [Cyanobium sp.]
MTSTLSFKMFKLKGFAVAGVATLSAIAATTLAAMGSAQAAPTTFSFSGADNSKTSILKSLDGITLKMENFTPGPNTFADSDGLAILAPNFVSPQKLTSFTMTFDQPVKLLNYNLGYLQNISGITTTYSQNSLQSIQAYTTTGLTLFTNQFIAQANVPISVTSTSTTANALAQINALTVEKQASVPSVPGPLPLFGAGAAYGWSRRLRRRLSNP